ncbi:MAG TPA: phosphatidate cytidylyltransferase [Chitinophagaceae bacterium]|nr:phosphatidate cytidylyltransferase [Chitinophagaceae bacterium]
MAFNRQTFKTRTLTAAVFAAVMLTGLLWNQWSFLVLFSVIHFGCWWEYLKLVENIHKVNFHPYLKMGLMVMGYGLMLWFCGPSFQLNGYGLKENISLPVSAAGFALVLTGIFQKNKIGAKSFVTTLFGLLYISLSWGLMMGLYNQIDIHIQGAMYVTDSAFIALAIIASIWINDTMAYIIGSLIGKTPLSKISPKKTWEGTIGGIILSTMLMYFLWMILFYSIHNGSMNLLVGVIAAIAAVAGTFGDLLESKLKRMAGVKDSGAIMPGHGGFLDRFYSLLLATPFVWIYVMFILK